jgi:hypothetical protein
VKSFVYTYKVNRTEFSVQKTVRIYRIIKNRLQDVGVMVDTFVDEFQLVMKVLEHHNALPPACFARHTNGCRIYSSAQKLEEDGFAVIERIE